MSETKTLADTPPAPPPPAPKAGPGPEPEGPLHLRFENGSVVELLDHVKAWIEWRLKKN